MGAERTKEGSRRNRLAPAEGALLALVIERPSYGYELCRRFDDRFGELHPISNSRVYQLLDRMDQQGLIELMNDEVPPTGRQPRTPYRATPEGARRHRQWLATSIQDDPRRQEVLRRLLATGARDARQMLRVIDVYEDALLADMGRGSSTAQYQEEAASSLDLRERLIQEERRLANEAALKFVAYARTLIDAETEGRGA